MNTAPCPRCGRHVLRDGAVGLLVCTCGEVLEIPSDLEGGISPKERDKRWYGTDGEREDLWELGLPEPNLPTRQQAIEQLQRRVAEQQAQTKRELEAGTLERDQRLEAYEKLRQELEKE